MRKTHDKKGTQARQIKEARDRGEVVKDSY